MTDEEAIAFFDAYYNKVINTRIKLHKRRPKQIENKDVYD